MVCRGRPRRAWVGVGVDTLGEGKQIAQNEGRRKRRFNAKNDTPGATAGLPSSAVVVYAITLRHRTDHVGDELGTIPGTRTDIDILGKCRQMFCRPRKPRRLLGLRKPP